jgi:ribosome production factor 2
MKGLKRGRNEDDDEEVGVEDSASEGDDEEKTPKKVRV